MTEGERERGREGGREGSSIYVVIHGMLILMLL